jgi:hypothetical protein
MKKIILSLGCLLVLIFFISGCSGELTIGKTGQGTEDINENINERAAGNIAKSTAEDAARNAIGAPGSSCNTDDDCFADLICLNSKCDVPTPENLARQKMIENNFERTYQEKIKSAFVLPLMRIPAEPSAPEKKESLDDSLLIKDRLATNTYSTQIHYHYQDGTFKLGVTGPKGTPAIPDFITWQDIKNQLTGAKKSGLAVNLMVTWGNMGLPGLC